MKTSVLFFILLCSKVLRLRASKFGYGRMDQMKWKKDFQSCGGILQSPIMIDSLKAISIGMPAVETIRYRNVFHDPLILKNNGHSVSLSLELAQNCLDYDSEIPYIFGGLLNGEYVFEGLHFHWGGRNNRGSEHILDDIRFPMEMHLVHRNRKYRNVQEALKHKDGLSVLGVFFQLSDKKNKHLDSLLQNFPSIQKFDQKVKFEDPFRLSSLLPHDADRFYTYKGSLTTPPCSEVVTWILYPNPVPISLSQMNEFRCIFDESGNFTMIDNYRLLQPLGSRKIFVRDPNATFSKYFSKANFLQWNWFHYENVIRQ